MEVIRFYLKCGTRTLFF